MSLRSGILVGVTVLVVASTLLTGCQGIKIGYRGTSRTGHMAATYHQFTGGESHTVTIKQDQVLRLEYELHAEQGELTVGVFAPDGAELWTHSPERSNSGSIALRAEESGDYRVTAVGKDTRGSFALSWRVE